MTDESQVLASGADECALGMMQLGCRGRGREGKHMRAEIPVPQEWRALCVGVALN